MQGCPFKRHPSLRKRLSEHAWHVSVATVRLTLLQRGNHKRIGLAPTPKPSLPTIANVGVPTAAAMCSGPASTLITARAWAEAPASWMREVRPRKSTRAVWASNCSSPSPEL